MEGYSINSILKMDDADALHKAIMNYYEKKEGTGRMARGEKVEPLDQAKETRCYCPYCELELPEEAPYCSNCGKPTLIE